MINTISARNFQELFSIRSYKFTYFSIVQLVPGKNTAPNLKLRGFNFTDGKILRILNNNNRMWWKRKKIFYGKRNLVRAICQIKPMYCVAYVYTITAKYIHMWIMFCDACKNVNSKIKRRPAENIMIQIQLPWMIKCLHWFSIYSTKSHFIFPISVQHWLILCQRADCEMELLYEFIMVYFCRIIPDLAIHPNFKHSSKISV